MEKNREAELMGQIAALGIAVQAIVSSLPEPQREQVAAKIHEGLEQATSRALGTGFPDEFLDGMGLVRRLYLMKAAEDPGQPHRKPQP